MPGIVNAKVVPSRRAQPCRGLIIFCVHQMH